MNRKIRISLFSIFLPGLFFLPMFSSEVSPLSTPPPSPPGAAADESRSALTDREKKILVILSQFRTGLKPEEKERLVTFISDESRRYGFEPELIVALISTESSFYNWSSSSKGAIGLMQLIPATGREMAEINKIVWQGEKEFLFNPFLNIKLGVHYLSMLYLRFRDIELALTAYNYGPGNVRRWINEREAIPAGYATKVLSAYEKVLAFDMETQEAWDLVKSLQESSAVEEEAQPASASKASLRS